VAQAALVVVGRIATLAGDAGPGWVEAIAIAAGRVIVAGSRDDAEAVAGSGTRWLRLAEDEIVLPGLTDAHLHLAEGGLGEERVDLESSTSLDAALVAIRRAAREWPGDAWLEGHGWDPDRLGGWPTAAAIESVAPGRRVAIWAHDHHALWVSQAALVAADVDDHTADPPGGLIRRDHAGRATGVLHETASRMVMGAIPPPTARDIQRGVLGLGRRLASLGVVAVHDPGALSLQAGLGPAFHAYGTMSDAGTLPIRVHASIRQEQLDAAIDARLRSGQPLDARADDDARPRARFGWLKLFADGTLASRTAALLAPIEPDSEAPVQPDLEQGMFTTQPDELATLAARAADAGIATQIHSIGDRAVRVALDALAPTSGLASLLPRVEHVQLVDPADLHRFGRQRIVASVQPVHLRTDAPIARRLWGTRAERSGYAWRSLLDAQAVVAFGTDAPVEPIDPWPGLAMAVTRSHPSWPGERTGFGPAERLSLDDVVRAACIAPAVAAGESDRGRLTAGQRADLIVLAAAAVAEPTEPDGALANARPRLVLIDGEVAFEA
jgi:predicted amidohydrolase YtcJ